MSRIHILSPHIANQIAAGEVVERPSSVLKEALENSLDAGSKQIDVIIERGGIGLIQVQDNGCGICKEDLKLALMQHATSKIMTSEDLEGVLSLGFRGEALASISAVAKTTLSSRTQDAENGWSIQQTGKNSEGSLIPASLPVGTRLEIRDLFYNTPVRRKFLKSEKTEWGHLQETFKRIALSHPEVAFSLAEGDRLYKRLPACVMDTIDMHAKRVAALCGMAFMNHAFYIEAENNGLILKGWLGSAESARAQPDIQYFYVNGRIVRDKVVNHAIRQAYEHCPSGRYPAYVLYFECDPTSVDVNVHPTKHEVRFREARTVHAFLAYSIQEALGKDSIAGGARTTPRSKPMTFDSTLEAEISEAQDTDREYFISTREKWKDCLKPLSILGGEFLLAEHSNGLWIADIKAIRYQSTLQLLQDAYQDQTLSNSKRSLLMPKTVDLGEAITERAMHVCAWDRLGFEWNQIGPGQLLVRAVPAVLNAKMENIEALMMALCTAMDDDNRLEKMAHYVAEDKDFSTADALNLLNQISGEQYSKLYKQISIDVLRDIVYRR